MGKRLEAIIRLGSVTALVVLTVLSLLEHQWELVNDISHALLGSSAGADGGQKQNKASSPIITTNEASRQLLPSEGQGQNSNAQQNSNNKKVLFYLYPFEEFPSFWGEHSPCDHSKPLTPKHDHADFAWQAMMRHPWRTRDPHQAQIAILPLALDLWSRGGCGKKRLALEQVLNETRRVLQASPIFPNVRHLIIANDFKTKGSTKSILELLSPAGIVAGMEGRAECKTSLGYTSNHAVYASMRMPNHVQMPTPNINLLDSSQRIYSVHMVGQVDNRPAYTDRKVLFESKGDIPSPYITTNSESLGLRHCNTTTSKNNNTNDDYDRCVNPSSKRKETQVAQERSNYTLCLRGDTLGSDRWINAMVAGTALIQVADDEDKALAWLPFPHAVPWKDIVITINRTDYLRDPAAAIRHILENTSERLLELQKLSLYYAADLDWAAYHSRTLENLVYEAYTVPCEKFEKAIESNTETMATLHSTTS